MKHYYNCIVLAEKEILLQTNYWQPSDSVNTIADALRELSRRVGQRKGAKVVVKIMWDRGSIKQVFRNHVNVPPSVYSKLDLPPPSELPHLDVQVLNFHRPLMGTFHQKAMIVDRKVALLNSNNVSWIHDYCLLHHRFRLTRHLDSAHSASPRFKIDPTSK